MPCGRFRRHQADSDFQGHRRKRGFKHQKRYRPRYATVHSIPPALTGVVPTAAGGLGDAHTAAEASRFNPYALSEEYAQNRL
ncbi:MULTISPECIES: hypothetical protein [Neisseria]|uniref:hypothetical protein n=1 Tax=Neisseria TaxID=482 RepID=UPI002657D124|nr:MULTISPECIES: hypothetical protein [Neisseria]